MILIKKKNQKIIKKFLDNDQKIYLCLILSFLGIGLLGILNHAMWRDELNGWLIARDSHSLENFFQAIKYEGHPLLWYVCLGLLNQFTANPVAMQIFHLVIATGCTALFVIFSPFSRLQKALFIFGYLPFYEYLLISRNYAIGILGIWLFCTFFNTRKTSYLLLCAILVLIANTNAYCLLISIALGLTLVFEYLIKEKINQELTASRNNIVISILILITGIIISVITLIPPPDSHLQGGGNQWMFQLDFSQLIKTIPRIWNSYILIVVPGDGKPLALFAFSILSLGLFAFATTLLIKKPIALFFYLIGSLEILLFTYVKFLGFPRHYGHLYIILIASFWLANYYSNSDLLINILEKLPQKIKALLNIWIRWVHQYKTTFIMIILYCQLAAGMVSFSRDLFVPYSASRETANFIKKNQLDKLLIVGSEDFAVSPLSGYLNQKIYYPEIKQLGSFVIFNSQRSIPNTQETLAQVSQLLKQHQEIILVLNSDVNLSKDDLIITPLQKFTNALIGNEKYYLYRIKAKLKQ